MMAPNCPKILKPMELNNVSFSMCIYMAIFRIPRIYFSEIGSHPISPWGRRQPHSHHFLSPEPHNSLSSCMIWHNLGGGKGVARSGSGLCSMLIFGPWRLVPLWDRYERTRWSLFPIFVVMWRNYTSNKFPRFSLFQFDKFSSLFSFFWPSACFACWPLPGCSSWFGPLFSKRYTNTNKS